jgi:hypothetical protein
MPERLKTAEPEDFFKFEFVMLPNYRYELENFIQQAKQLKERFQLNAPNTLFLQDFEQNNVPMDGVPFFVQQNWELIRNEKDLDLPN